MTRLVDAYLDYRSRDSGDGFPTSVQSAVSPEADEEPPEYPPGTIVNIELVDMFSKCSFVVDERLHLSVKQQGGRQHSSLVRATFTRTRISSIMDILAALLFTLLLPFLSAPLPPFDKRTVLAHDLASRHNARHCVIFTT